MAKQIAEKLFPPIKPYHSGYLAVGDGHEIYYEECGNPNGVPVLYLHGGPGAGCDENARRFFNPKKCRVLLFDQRGSGRSKPYASISANTLWRLVEDIQKLLAYRGIEKVLLFGGSWGSTLALVYAECHPGNVLGMVLRGIFLSEQAEVRDYCEGVSNTRFPELWKRFISNIPLKFRRSRPVDSYFAQMTGDGEKTKAHYAYEWAYYESARLNLVPKNDKELEREIKSEPYVALSILEAHYIRHLCFLDDGFIMRNIERIPHVPVSIIHGRYDDVCMVESAIKLHRALPGSTLHIVVAGHSRSDPEILKKLVSETDSMISKLRK
ncbi:MAG: prolyl aminopeptidase [bacterium]|nr:prolyl aminopeptidase [bacterium]